MPTYEYQCDYCDHKFEEFQGINDPILKKCPQCNKNKLRRLFGTGGGLLFKGSGFYKTDYRSESYSKAAKAESGSSSSDVKSTSGSSNNATATKSSEKSAPSKDA